jgi:hypothetical protein
MTNYFQIIYNSSPKGESGEKLGQEYSLEGCKICGTGSELLGNTITKGMEKLNLDFFMTLHWDFFISEKLYVLLKGYYKIDLDNTIQAVNTKNKKIPFFHLKVTSSLPKSSLFDGVEIEEQFQCKVCKRNGYFNQLIRNSKGKNEIAHTKIVYPSSIFNANKPDILQTWENFGTSNLIVKGDNVLGFSRPATLISQKLKDVFTELKLKNIEYIGEIIVDK